MNLLTITNLAKQFSERLLFEGASLLINEGDRIGLIGINGSGKSTLLRVIAGLEAPDGGSVTSPGGVRIEYLPQEPPLDDSLTVLETIFRSSSPQMQLLAAYMTEPGYRAEAFERMRTSYKTRLEQVSATPRLPITIEVSAGAGRLPVAGDLSRLRRAWQNIIRNVIDAAEARGGEKVKLNIFTRRTGNFARIQFADNAGGIARSRVSRVFEPFFTTRGEKNRGLGLFIARKIVGEHAGKIRVVSKKPFTRVTIDLPLMP